MTPEILPPETTTISLEPDYENLATWLGDALRTHSFNKGAKEPIADFIKIIRYLAVKDMDAYIRVLNRFQ